MYPIPTKISKQNKTQKLIKKITKIQRSKVMLCFQTR